MGTTLPIGPYKNFAACRIGVARRNPSWGPKRVGAYCAGIARRVGELQEIPPEFRTLEEEEAIKMQMTEDQCTLCGNWVEDIKQHLKTIHVVQG